MRTLPYSCNRKPSNGNAVSIRLSLGFFRGNNSITTRRFQNGDQRKFCLACHGTVHVHCSGAILAHEAPASEARSKNFHEMRCSIMNDPRDGNVPSESIDCQSRTITSVAAFIILRGTCALSSARASTELSTPRPPCGVELRSVGRVRRWLFERPLAVSASKSACE